MTSDQEQKGEKGENGNGGGVLGFAPHPLTGKKLSSLTQTSIKITKPRNDIFIGGENPNDPDKRFEDNKIYMTEGLPAICPFCNDKIHIVIGHLIKFRGTSNVGVGVCPKCHRIFGEY